MQLNGIGLQRVFTSSFPLSLTCVNNARGQKALCFIWWDCDMLQPFWREVHELITQITTYTQDYNPAQFLLHHTTLPKKVYFKSLAMHMVNVARLCVPVHWRSTDIPSIREWLTRFTKIEEMGELIHTAHELIQTFTNTWACWAHFKTTEHFGSYFP